MAALILISLEHLTRGLGFNLECWRGWRIFQQTLGQKTAEQRAGVEGGAEVEGPRRGRGAGRGWASRSGNENKTRAELRENERESD